MNKNYCSANIFSFCGTIVLSLVFFFSTATAAELKFVTQDFPPFNYEVDGVVSGPAADIINATCRELGISCSFDLLPWSRAQLYTKIGKAHAMFVIGWNEERAKWLHFSSAIIETEYGFFVRDDNPLAFKNTADVKGYSVGVYGPSNTSHSLEMVKAKIEDITIHIISDDKVAFKLLSSGRIDAVYSNREVGKALVKKMGLKNIRYAGCHRKLKYYIGFSKKFTDPKLVERFNATLLKLQQQGKTEAILRTYQMGATEDQRENP